MSSRKIIPPRASSRLKLVFEPSKKLLNSSTLPRIVLFTLFLRLALGLLGMLVLSYGEVGGPAGRWPEFALQPGQSGYLILAPWQRWDALWYIKIAADGYAAGNGTTAFFPLFPLAMRVAASILDEQYTVGGLLITTVAFMAGLAFLWKLVSHDFSPTVARRTVVYLALFPTAFFFLAPFTESLFLLTAVASLYGARTGRWWLAGIAGGLAGITRAQGLLLVLPLAYEYWHQHRQITPKMIVSGIPVLLPAVSWASFMGYTVLVTNKLPGQELVEQWGYTVRLPTDLLAASLEHIAKYQSRFETLSLICLVLFSIAAIVGLRRLPFTYFLYVAPQLLLLATRQMAHAPLMSVSRYILPLFPAVILLSLYSERRSIRYPILIVFVLLLAYCFTYFVLWDFVA